MTDIELIDDLDSRIQRGMVVLADKARKTPDKLERNRLLGKREGLVLVADWLRSYR